jgi:hypothetical protein
MQLCAHVLGQVAFGNKSFPSKFLMYHEKVKTTKVYVRDARCDPLGQL